MVRHVSAVDSVWAPVCCVARILLLALFFPKGAARDDQGRERVSLPDTCECNWDDNKWIHLVSDFLHVFSHGYAERAASVLSLRESDNASAEATRQRLFDGTFTHDGLCSASPEIMIGTSSAKGQVDKSWLKLVVSASEHHADHAVFLKELCLPGQLAQDVLCTQHSLLFHVAGPRAALRTESLAQRRIRRTSVLLPFVAHCLASSSWPLDVEPLETYVSAWLFAADSNDAHLALYDAPVTLESFRSSLPQQLQRCLPTAANGCWPRQIETLGESCMRCCDPRFPRGNWLCFDRVWSFEVCCTPDDLTTGWGPAPSDIEEVTVFRKSDEVEELREELRVEIKAGVSRSSQGQQARHNGARPVRDEEWSTLHRWVVDARTNPRGLQKIFPELDLIVSTKACVGPEAELPWFLVDAESDGTEDSLSDRSSGVELAAAFGALCGPGTPVRGELVARAGRRALVPRDRPDDEPTPHRLEPYGLELMTACTLNTTCSCGAAWCNSHNQCCHEGTNVEWRDVGLLMGERRSNIAHFARDALWLHRLFQERLPPALAGGFRSSLLGGAADEVPELVLTKHAATECRENDQCVKTGRIASMDMERFMTNVALSDVEVVPPVFMAGDPDRKHPICYEVVAQRWRPWAGDADSIQSFRARALQRCGIVDAGITRKIVVVRRDAPSRHWQDEHDLKRDLGALSSAIHSSLLVVNLGRLDACEQVRVLHDAMLFIAIHGADLTNMVFLPQSAAVVEVAVECEVEGSGVDSNFWRGPGTLMNSSVYRMAVDTWSRQESLGMCPRAGATDESWLQGFPVSQFAKLARQANLLYTAVMDCSATDCSERPMGHVWDRAWCTSNVKNRLSVKVDVRVQLLPVIWAIFDEYLRWRTAPWVP